MYFSANLLVHKWGNVYFCSMKVTLIQMDVAWGEPGTNRETAERAILSAEKSDLYVLPEMWNTG